MTCKVFCDVPSALKSIWCEDEILNSGIEACGSTETAFFDEGVSIGDISLPYVVLLQGQPSAPKSLGPGAFLDTKPYQLKIYGNSRLFLNELSRAARNAYTNAGCLETEEGSVCKISIGPASRLLFGDGTRVNIHQLTLMVISKVEVI